MWEVLEPSGGITQKMRQQCISPGTVVPKIILDYDKTMMANMEEKAVEEE